MTLLEFFLLFAAGFVGGVLNSIAGGGSFITFPALIFVGVAPISANATNTFASFAGYLSGSYAFREDLTKCKQALPRLVLLSLIGGITGAWLLLQTSEAVFRGSIPWLLLFATLLFAFGGRINASLKRLTAEHRYATGVGGFLLSVMLLAVCVYGGFFNAGLGIIVLSYLALAGYSDINQMNGIKLLVSAVVSFIAILVFILDDLIAWQQGILVLVGAMLGGYMAAKISKRFSQQYIRYFVLVASSLITTYFFIDTYLLTPASPK